LATDLSPYSTNSVILQDTGVSLFQETTGEASFGALPPNTATIKMQASSSAGQTYVFDPLKDKFKYLSSNTNYDESQINTLLPLLNTATPIVLNGSQYEADFTYTPAESYLYLVLGFERAYSD